VSWWTKLLRALPGQGLLWSILRSVSVTTINMNWQQDITCDLWHQYA